MQELPQVITSGDARIGQKVWDVRDGCYGMIVCIHRWSNGYELFSLDQGNGLEHGGLEATQFVVLD